MPRILAAIVLALSMLPVPARARQDAAPPPIDGPKPSISIPRVPRSPTLDDFLDMEAPADLAAVMTRIDGGFIQREPVDGAPASQHTDVYLGYDDRYLYAVFVAFDDEPERIRANYSRREQVFGDDIVEIQLDTFRDELRAYTFICNPLGVQWDAVWREGSGFDESWNAVWKSNGKLTDRGYVVWMAIDFKFLRFPADLEDPWGIILVRDIPRVNESSFYPRVTERIEGRMNQAGTLTGLSGISPGRNIQLIPYATGRNFRVLDPRAEEQPTFAEDDAELDAGLDAKFVFQDQFVLDVTLNPDFSQVESDEAQVTVNQRFEVFFPERRPFFLENADFFATPINLLFTRRILDPRLGARMTGKFGPNNFGVLAIDDEGPGRLVDEDSELRGAVARNLVGRYSRDILTQSRIGGIVTDRTISDGYNRVASVDGRFKLGTNWVMNAQAAFSSTRQVDSAGSDADGTAFDLVVEREGRYFETHLHYFDYSEDFETWLGFVPRTDIREVHGQLEYTFWPEKTLISWGPSLFAVYNEDRNGVRLDQAINPTLSFEFPRQTRIRLFARTGKERVRVQDYGGDPATDDDVDLDSENLGVFVRSQITRTVDFNFEYVTGKTGNFAPVDPDPDDGYLPPPTPADVRSVQGRLGLRLFRRMRLDTDVFHTELTEPGTGRSILDDTIVRSRFSWQFDPRATIRLIARWDRRDPNPELSSERKIRRVDLDFLFTYLINPWTALYVGYNNLDTNLAFVETPGGTETIRTDSADFNAGRQLFVKFSYLFAL